MHFPGHHPSGWGILRLLCIQEMNHEDDPSFRARIRGLRHLLVDILYSILDPRVRLGEQSA
jgi:hypothetical protein